MPQGRSGAAGRIKLCITGCAGWLLRWQSNSPGEVLGHQVHQVGVRCSKWYCGVPLCLYIGVMRTSTCFVNVFLASFTTVHTSVAFLSFLPLCRRGLCGVLRPAWWSRWRTLPESQGLAVAPCRMH